MKKLLLSSLTAMCFATAFSQVDIDKSINLSNTNPADAKISGIKSVGASQDALSVEAFQKGSFIFAGISAGGPTTYTASLTPAITVYTNGMAIYFKANIACSAGPVTININTAGAKTIKKNGNDLAAGDIAANQLVCIVYDGANFNLSGGAGNGLSSVSTNATLSGNGTSGSPLDIATVGAGGSFNNVTVNTKGQVTGGSTVAYLTSEVDGSTTNEIQTLSGSGTNDISLSSSPGTITLQGGGVTSIARTGNTFTISSTDNNSGGTITGSGSPNQVARWTSASAIGNGALFDNGTNIAMGTTTTNNMFQLRSDGNTQAMQFNTSGYVVANQWGTRMFKSDIGGGIPLKLETQYTGTWYGSADFDHGQDVGHPSLKTYYNTLLATSGGLVGIGTTSPSATLSVIANKVGTSSNWYDPGNYAGYVHHGNNNTQRYGMLVSDYWRAPENYLFAVDGRFFIDGTVANDLHNAYFTVRGDGNVGIGTASPGQKLTVAGTVESTSGGFKFPDATTQTSAAAWRKISETTSVANATSITVSSLDLDAAKVFMVFLVTPNTTTGGEVRMYFNNDLTDANYLSMHGHIYSGGLGQAIRGYPEIGSTSTNGTMFADIKIMRGGDGHPRFLVHETEMQSGSDGEHLYGGRYKSNTNVTSITIRHTATNGLGTGTKIIVLGLF